MDDHGAPRDGGEGAPGGRNPDGTGDTPVDGASGLTDGLPEPDRERAAGDAGESGADAPLDTAGLDTTSGPSPFLEERVVRALRTEGILRFPSFRPRWLVGGAVAALALFLGGLGFGHALGSRGTTEAFLAVRAQDTAMAAAHVQEAGSAYVAALAALADLGAGDGEVAAQGREAALVALYAAVAELWRMSPDDASVSLALEAVEAALTGGGGDGAEGEVRQVVWF